ncbi:MAG: group II intron reverse transcriptase/maturase, partial [Bdellovibrionia bacterium]
MSIHSIDGIAWSARLEHIGVVSARNKNTVFNNISHHVNEETLKRCFDRIDGTKAIGIDGITKEVYGKNLESNLKNLLMRIRRGTYDPKPARIVEIPKEDGSTRPLAISCLEDKIVQMCVNNILTRIYEPLFLSCSYGARPKLSCIDALRDVNQTAF